MPIRLEAYTRFQWCERDGQPVAQVATFGGIAYILVCPLCSAMHELPGVTFAEIGQEQNVRPRCLLREFAGQGRDQGQTATWMMICQAWLKLHPQAANYAEVKAVYIGRGSDLREPLEGIGSYTPMAADAKGRKRRQAIAPVTAAAAI